MALLHNAGFARVAVAAALALGVGCSDSTGPGGGPDPADIASIRLDYRDGSAHIAHTHGSGASMEWHGSLHLHPGDEVEIDVTFRNAAGDTLRFFAHGEYTLSASVASGSPSGVVAIDIHGDHLELTAIGEGTVDLIISVMHGGHSDYDSPLLEVEVEDHHQGSPSPAGIVSIPIVDRDSDVEPGPYAWKR